MPFRNYLIFVLIIAGAQSALAQQDTNAFKVRLLFTDKANTGFSLQNPQAFLSVRALQRRQQMNIGLDSSDLPVSQAYLDSISRRGGKVMFTSKWFNAAVAEVADSQMMLDLLALPFIKSSQKVALLNIGPDAVLEKTSQAEVLNYGTGFRQVEMLNGHVLHQMGFTGRGKIIAVHDVGFANVNTMRAFAHLRERNGIVATKDFYENSSFVYAYGVHGTTVLSIMAAKLPGELAGTAVGADYILLRSEFGASENLVEEDAWVAAAEFSDSAGADIINSSLGYHFFDDSTQNHTWPQFDGNTLYITRGADMAAAKGILVVSSAGNQGNSAWRKITAPADADSILTIGAVDADEWYASFSSRGPTADGRLKPEISAMGARAVVANPNDTGVLLSNGTSNSAPLISGMAACLWQAFPQLTNMQLRDIIIRSSSQYWWPDTFKGYGVPDFYRAYLLASEETNTTIEKPVLLSLGPNPFRDKINVTMYSSQEQEWQVQLITITGKVLHVLPLHLRADVTEKIEMQFPQNLPAGVYLLQFIGNEKKFTKKIVKF